MGVLLVFRQFMLAEGRWQQIIRRGFGLAGKMLILDGLIGGLVEERIE